MHVSDPGQPHNLSVEPVIRLSMTAFRAGKTVLSTKTALSDRKQWEMRNWWYDSYVEQMEAIDSITTAPNAISSSTVNVTVSKLQKSLETQKSNAMRVSVLSVLMIISTAVSNVSSYSTRSCANLPRKLDHALHKHPLFLDPGLRELDINCILVPEWFTHKSHQQHLLFISTSYNAADEILCQGCKGSIRGDHLHCTLCEFAICYKCATIPDEIYYKYDEHPLSLCYGKVVWMRMRCGGAKFVRKD
ncbi:unnamed protein product [Microthlaspi erraticum]|uniref:DC1 domain-containing protein n=1 Tax=Microthlaspi erraticum TaxID=1685480 RepID=A0A6D2HQ50_9BRAS|nr:unnamed protein product [Microthlaspi erraticum]